MTKLLEILIILFVLWTIWNLVSVISKRLRLVRKLSLLKKMTGAEIKYHRSPLFTFGKPSLTPDITVRIGGTLYLIRLYNGGGIGKIVHFASPKFTVRFSRMRTANYVRRGRSTALIPSKHGFAIGTRVIPVSPVDRSAFPPGDGLKVVPVWIFNPAPGEVSLVTEAKTSIVVAFTGDFVYGEQIFTASTFVAYAERVYREEKRIEEASVRLDFDYAFI